MEGFIFLLILDVHFFLLIYLFIFQYLFQIICFLVKVVPLTKIDLKRILWLLHPEVQCALGTRAVLAAHFLLPGMKMAKTGNLSFLS
jgi:hypothetical protein